MLYHIFPAQQHHHYHLIKVKIINENSSVQTYGIILFKYEYFNENEENFVLENCKCSLDVIGTPGGYLLYLCMGVCI